MGCTITPLDTLVRATIVSVCLLLGASLRPIHASGQSENEAPQEVGLHPEVLSSLSEVRSLDERCTCGSIPIDMPLEVNFWDRRGGGHAFVRDQHMALYLDVSKQLFAEHPKLAPGTKIRLKGECVFAGKYLRASEIEVIGHESGTEPLKADMTQIPLGKFWSYRVATRGVVQEVLQNGDHWRAVLQDGETRFQIYRIDSENKFRWRRYIGYPVQIEGTLSYRRDFNHAPALAIIRASELDPSVKIASRYKDIDRKDLQPDSVELSIEELRELTTSTDEVYRLRGQITSVTEGKGFILEVGGHGMFVHSELVAKANIGDVADVKMLYLGDSKFRAVATTKRSRESVDPPAVRSADAVLPSELPYRVRLNADVLSVFSQGDKRILTLRDGDTVFESSMIVDDRVWDEMKLASARQVALTGIAYAADANGDELATHDSSIAAFTVEVADAKGIQVLSRWWQFSPPLAMSIMGVVAVLCTLGMLWFAALWIRLGRTHDENHRLQTQLLQSQKMDAIGRLAGGVAHDFNNLLAGISSNLELAELHETQSSGLRDQCLASARQCTNQAIRLVGSLLAFSRKSELVIQRDDVNEAIANVALIAEHTMGPDVEFKLDLSEQLLPCRFDRGQMDQVFLNLFFNARDAFEDGAGLIYVSTQNVIVGDETMVEIHVSDTGSGMDEDTIAKAFEPFFTTKPVGKGTGLGLALVYGIVQQHGGTIDCESQSGIGTEFRLRLPADEILGITRDFDPAGESDSEDGPIRLIQSPPRELHVLLVDDNEGVRRVARLSLETLGHRVTTASGGSEAIRLLDEQGDFDLAILDLSMPGMSGRETYRYAKELCPKLAVIITSGYLTDVEGFERDTGFRPDGFLPKPFQLADLKAMLDRVASDEPVPAA